MMVTDLESLNRTNANLLVHDSAVIEDFEYFTSQTELFNYGEDWRPFRAGNSVRLVF